MAQQHSSHLQKKNHVSINANQIWWCCFTSAYKPLLMLVKGPSFSVKPWLYSEPRFGGVGLNWSTLGSLSIEVIHKSKARALPTGSGLPLLAICCRSASTFLFASNKSWISRSFASRNNLNWRLTVSLSGINRMEMFLYFTGAWLPGRNFEMWVCFCESFIITNGCGGSKEGSMDSAKSPFLPQIRLERPGNGVSDIPVVLRNSNPPAQNPGSAPEWVYVWKENQRSSR